MKSNWKILAVVILGWVALFLFYGIGLPYHLFHREQTQLFLWDWEPLSAYVQEPAVLARFLGDALTQYFYYEWMGPAILATVLVLWGWGVYRLMRPYVSRWAGVWALGAVLWEAGRQCGLSYPLWGTLSLTGFVFTWCCARKCFTYASRWRAIGMLAIWMVGVYLFGFGQWKAPAWDRPRFELERLLGMDCETYFGRQDRLKSLFDQETDSSAQISYYKNFWLAQRHQLSDSLLHGYQPVSYGLFLPVIPNSDYFKIYAANEVWFALGDMTLAEHAAMLGMIFSPQHMGTRAIRRLAEINLIVGDEAAALKYLRLLQKTSCHREWAQRRWPGRQTTEVQRWLEQKRRFLPQTDTLRASANVALSLRLLLDANPDNVMAREYLLCVDLLHKDMESFMRDYRQYAMKMVPSRLYAEAILIYLAGKQASLQEVQSWNLPVEWVKEFGEYNRLYETHQGNGYALQAKYGHTYWFYFHYATFKQTTDEK